MNPTLYDIKPSSYPMFAENVLGRVIGVEAPAKAPDSLNLTMYLTQFQGGCISRIENRGEAFEVTRTRQRIASDTTSAWVVGVCLEGTQVMSLRPGHELRSERSELLITHSQIPHVGITAPRTRVGVLILPDGSELGKGWGPALLPAREGFARVLSESLRSLFEELPTLKPYELRALLSSLFPLISAVAARSHDGPGLAASVREVRRRRAIRFIDAHLADPRLGAHWIAEQLRISTRYLHALFVDTDTTVGRTILTRRLQRCREAMMNPANSRSSIFDLALQFGFNDPSHFSRAYRRHFGVSPREDRANHCAASRDTPSIGLRRG